ncbi:MAG: hypothetical protein R2769_08360 [Saprospiraceae bacterium]
MLGKIIGVGAVGLTQILIWAILIPAITIPINLIFGFDSNQLSSNMQGAAAQVDPDDMQAMVSMAMAELEAMNWWMILPLFILYFLGGYFLYSSMFAAVGSAIVMRRRTIFRTLPITIPVILALYIMMGLY